MRVLITGGAGFIGSNIVKKLLEMGNKVRVIDNLITGKMENIAEFEGNPNFEFVRGDIRVRDMALMVCKDCDAICHQAALGSVPRSLDNPLTTFHHNLIGTVSLLDATRHHGIKRFVFASTSAVYGDTPELPKVEPKLGAPKSPYAISKLCGEQMARLYADLYGIETIGLRYFNVFGPKQNPAGSYAAVIPRFIQNALKGRQNSIYGNGAQTRDFTFVDNVVAANVAALTTTNAVCFSKVYNIAGANQVSVNELHQKINQLTNNVIEPLYLADRPGDILHSFADISAAKKELEYSPIIDFDTGLSLTINYFKNN